MKPTINDIMQMLLDRPEVKTTEFWPDECGLYTLSGIKRYMKAKGYSHDMTDQAMYQIANDKKLIISFVRIKNNKYNETYPYYYKDLSEKELNDLMELYNGYVN